MNASRKEKGRPTMPDSEAKVRWMRENTTVICVKLNHNTDKELIQFLDGKPSKAGLFKKALREYIQNHPKQYRVKPEYYDSWYGTIPTSEITGIVALNDITRLAAEWGMPVDELMEQVEEI